MTNKYRGETKLPGLDDWKSGLTFFLSNQDIAELQDELGEDFVPNVYSEMSRFNVKWIDPIIRTGIHRVEDGKRFTDVPGLQILGDALLSDIARACLDCVFRSVHGKSFDEYLKSIVDQAPEARGEENPTTTPRDGSLRSGAAPSA